jgi:hypothetical protein
MMPVWPFCSCPAPYWPLRAGFAVRICGCGTYNSAVFVNNNGVIYFSNLGLKSREGWLKVSL